jgi:hypothetical protein
MDYTLPKRVLVLFIVGIFGLIVTAILHAKEKADQCNGIGCAGGTPPEFIGAFIFFPLIVIAIITTLVSFFRRKRKGLFLSPLHRKLALISAIICIAYIVMQMISVIMIAL